MNDNRLAVVGLWTIGLFVIALYIGIYHVLRRVCPSSVIVRSVFCGIHFVEYVLFKLIFLENIFHIHWIATMSFSGLAIDLWIFFCGVGWLILLAELAELIVMGIRHGVRKKSRTGEKDHNDEQ